MLEPDCKAYTETKCGNTFTYCVKIWEESNSRAAVHREGHKGFDIQGRLHHQGRCAHKGGKCSSACQEQTKPGIHGILLSATHTAQLTQLPRKKLYRGWWKGPVGVNIIKRSLFTHSTDEAEPFLMALDTQMLKRRHMVYKSHWQVE